MKQIDYLITEPEGLHALPATALVEKLNKLDCQIIASLKGNAVDAKSMFGLMSLNARFGDKISFMANGKDEDYLASVLKR